MLFGDVLANFPWLLVTNHSNTNQGSPGVSFLFFGGWVGGEEGYSVITVLVTFSGYMTLSLTAFRKRYRSPVFVVMATNNSMNTGRRK